MNITTVLIGVVAVLFGLYTTFLRLKRPEKLGKLQAMKERFGANVGNLIHIVAYTVVPLVAGAVFVYFGVLGVALF